MKGVDLLNEKKLAVTKTEHKIGKTTYIICSSFSDKASELNQGHGDFQSPALPTELSGQIGGPSGT